jgi:hypothetical protein
MWIITDRRHYFKSASDDKIALIWTEVRDDAKRFPSKQEAKDFMAKHSITGSIIPA